MRAKPFQWVKFYIPFLLIMPLVIYNGKILPCSILHGCRPSTRLRHDTSPYLSFTVRLTRGTNHVPAMTIHWPVRLNVIFAGFRPLDRPVALGRQNAGDFDIFGTAACVSGADNIGRYHACAGFDAVCTCTTVDGVSPSPKP